MNKKTKQFFGKKWKLNASCSDIRYRKVFFDTTEMKIFYREARRCAIETYLNGDEYEINSKIIFEKDYSIWAINAPKCCDGDVNWFEHQDGVCKVVEIVLIRSNTIDTKLTNLEKKIQEYQNDFEFLKFEKQLLENRIISLKNKIDNLLNNED